MLRRFYLVTSLMRNNHKNPIYIILELSDVHSVREVISKDDELETGRS